MPRAVRMWRSPVRVIDSSILRNDRFMVDVVILVCVAWMLKQGFVIMTFAVYGDQGLVRCFLKYFALKLLRKINLIKNADIPKRNNLFFIATCLSRCCASTSFRMFCFEHEKALGIRCATMKAFFRKCLLLSSYYFLFRTLLKIHEIFETSKLQCRIVYFVSRVNNISFKLKHK